jgi:hypothetical protein
MANIINIEQTTNLNATTPFVNYMINKRINNCELKQFSHIAAIIPVAHKLRYCFILGFRKKWKCGIG